MYFNTSKLLFFSMLFMGTLISISSNSWPTIWTGLEINLMSFIPIMYSKNNMMTSEASMKYFLVQAMASSLFLMLFLMIIIINNINMLYNNTLITITLFLKMGAAPFHMWFPSVMEGLSWMNCFILMTWQKLAPLIILSYLQFNYWFNNIIIMMSLLVGSMGGLIQTSTRKIMAYSSINHIGWMLSAITISNSIWMSYYIMYTLLIMPLILYMNNMSLNHINQLNMSLLSNKTKLFFIMNMMSLGGLPPFLGFLPKWLILSNMFQLNLVPLMFMLVMTSLITLFYYMKLSINSLMTSTNHQKWFISFYFMTNSMNMSIMILMTYLSLIMLPLYSLNLILS